MEGPEIVIVIEGGLVSAVATIKDKLTYRIVDLDVTKVKDPEDSGITLPGSRFNRNVEEYRRRQNKKKPVTKLVRYDRSI